MPSMKVKKAKPSGNIVSGPKPFPKTEDPPPPFSGKNSFAGPGLSVKTSKSYKKGK